MKIYIKIMLLALVTLMMVGCSAKAPRPIIKTETKEVYVEVPCSIPKVSCDFEGPGFVPTKKLLECVITQKMALDTCAKFNEEKFNKEDVLRYRKQMLEK